MGKNGCGKSTLLALLKGELQAEAGSASFPSTWSLAWVNQETPALDVPALEYVIDGDREFRALEQQLQLANEKMMVMQSRPCMVNLMQLMLGASARASSLLHGLGFSQTSYKSL